MKNDQQQKKNIHLIYSGTRFEMSSKNSFQFHAHHHHRISSILLRVISVTKFFFSRKKKFDEIKK